MNNVELTAKRTIENVKKWLPNPNIQELDLTVLAIESDLCDRKGLKSEWGSIDDEIREEILSVWREIILQCRENRDTSKDGQYQIVHKQILKQLDDKIKTLEAERDSLDSALGESAKDVLNFVKQINDFKEQVEVLEKEIKRLRGFFKRPSGFRVVERARELYPDDIYEHAERARLINAYCLGFERSENYHIEQIVHLEERVRFLQNG